MSDRKEWKERDDQFPWEAWRSLLPAAEKYTYLNSAGCGPMAVPVLRAMEDAFEHMAAEGQVNPEIHREMKERLERVRQDVAAFIHADPEEIFFVRCIAEGLNIINRMFALKPGDEILISGQENPASILPCFVLEPELGTETRVFGGLGTAEDIVLQFQDALTERTRMAVMSHVFHTTGAAIPAKEICRIAEARNVVTVLDGAQAAGNIRINVQELGCDFYLLSCHKWLCGPEGIAAVYIRRKWLDQVRVPFGGVGMQEDFSFADHTVVPRRDARRFEYGGRHIPMYEAFSACIRLANQIGLERIIARKQELHRYCRRRFTEALPEVELLSPEDERLVTGIFAFRIPGVDHRQVVRQAWEEERMIIQWRTMDLNTKEEGIRVSLNWFVTEEEIEKLVAFVRRVLKPCP